MHMMDLWNLQGQLLLLLASGVLLRRLGIVSEHAKRVLTDLVIYVTLPCSIVLSFRMDIDQTIMVSLGTVLLISFAIQMFCILLGNLLYRKQDARKRAVLRYGILVSNSGFMGLPIAGELYGHYGGDVCFDLPDSATGWLCGQQDSLVLPQMSSPEGKKLRKLHVIRALCLCTSGWCSWYLTFRFQDSFFSRWNPLPSVLRRCRCS